MNELPDVSDYSDHRAAVAGLVAHMNWQHGAEVGLGTGHLSKRLMHSFPHLTMIGVDTLKKPDRAKSVREIASQYLARYQLRPMDSVRAARGVMDSSLDFVFIDAGHSYKAVRADIKAWRRKVRPGGWLLGHDYGHPKLPGVAQAVDEAFCDAVQVVGHTIWAVPAEVANP